MEDVSSILSELKNTALNQPNGAILLSYHFAGLRVRGIFFSRSITLLVGVVDKNVAWACDISDGKLSERIPNEAYRVIGAALVTMEDEQVKRSNKPFFERLKSELEEVISSKDTIAAPDDEEIKTLLWCCKTKDKKYDKEGERPFFKCWRRVSPSPEMKDKIQRNFGREVREQCYRNKVTAVWVSEPSEKSLLFLDPAAAIRDMPS